MLRQGRAGAANGVHFLSRAAFTGICLAALTAPGHGSPGPARDELNAEDAMQTHVREDGVKIAYVDRGSGPVVFLAHGQNGNHTSYDLQVPVLVDAGYRVIALDRIGRGRSDTGPTRFTSATEARDYWRLLDAAGVGRAVLVGHSSGAGLVQTMYLMRPERVIALVSLDSGTFGKVSERPPATLRPGAPLDSGLSARFDPETVVMYHRNKAALQSIMRLWDYPSDFNTRKLLEHVEANATNRKRWSALPPDPHAPEIPGRAPGKWCRVPLFVITAGRGRIGPDDPAAARMTQQVPAADAVTLVVKNSGHWVHWEAAERFNGALVAFLERVRRAVPAQGHEAAASGGMRTLVREGGRKLRYRDDGEGTAVLMVPGSAGVHDIYDPQVRPVVGAGFRAIRFDRVGRGASELGTCRYSGASEVADAWALLDHLGVERAVLMGRSSGSGVIQAMSRRHPERVIALISIDSTSFGKVADRPPATLRADAPLDAGLSARFDPDTVDLYHRNKSALQKIRRLWDYPSDYSTKMLMAWEVERERIREAWEALPPCPAQGEEPAPAAERCRVPVLVFTAGRGRIGPDDPEAVALAQRLSGDARLVVIKNTGHFMNVEAADAFNRELITFLRRLP